MAEPRKPAAPGPALPYTDADLDQLSTITAADAKAAARLWERDAPAWARKLLAARPAESDA